MQSTSLTILAIDNLASIPDITNIWNDINN